MNNSSNKTIKWLIWKMRILNEDLKIYFSLCVYPMVLLLLDFPFVTSGNYSSMKHVFANYITP